LAWSSSRRFLSAWDQLIAPVSSAALMSAFAAQVVARLLRAGQRLHVDAALPLLRSGECGRLEHVAEQLGIAELPGDHDCLLGKPMRGADIISARRFRHNGERQGGLPLIADRARNFQGTPRILLASRALASSTKPDPVPPDAQHLGRCLQGKPGFAAAAGSGQRQQPRGAELIADFGQFGLAADERADDHRQVIGQLGIVERGQLREVLDQERGR
jgi:hypothetical protein